MVAIERDPEFHGRVYKSPDDNAMLDVIQDAFERLWNRGGEVRHGEPPELLPLTTEEIIAALRKGVRQYRDVTIAVRQVNVSELKPLPKFLEAFKLVRAAALDRLLARHGLTPGARVKNSPWIITPPVIEQLGSGAKVIMDGTHRIYNAIQDGKTEVVVALVQNPKPNLPAEPFPDWQHIRILRQKVAPNERYKNFNNQEFRSILTAFKALARFDEKHDSRSKGDLVIIEGRYGTRDHRVDVVKQLNSAITDDNLHIYVGNQLAGDPCPNAPKDLFVRYRYKNREFEKTINEGADLDLP